MAATKYTREILQDAVQRVTSISGLCRELGVRNQSGGFARHLKNRLKFFEIDTSHFLGMAHARGSVARNKKPPHEILVAGYRNRAGATILRRAMLESGVAHVCAKCGRGPEWQGEYLPLDVDHIDGDWSNNQRDNLRFMCPNCHAQTPSFGYGSGPVRVGVCADSICMRVIQWSARKDAEYRKKQVRPMCGPCRMRVFMTKGPGRALTQQPEVGKWPDAQTLEQQVWRTPVSALAKEIGVSGSAVKKRCKRLAIRTPPRGYWQKQSSHRLVADQPPLKR